VIARRTVACLAAGAVLVAGCGGDDAPTPGKNAKRYFGDQRDVAQVVDDLASASRAGDTKRICSELFSSRLEKTIGAQAGGSCEAQVKKQLAMPDEDITVQQLAITGTRALVTVKEQSGKTSRLIFARVGTDWRIDTIQ
jgi:hypothetical protein